MGNICNNLNSHMEDFSHLPVIGCKWWNLDWASNPTLLHSLRTGGPWGQSSPYLHIKQTFNMYPLVQVNTFNFQGNLNIYYACFMCGYWLREVKFLTQGQKLLNDKARLKPRTSLFPYDPCPVYADSWNLKGFPGGSDSKESTCGMGDLGLIPGSGRKVL